MAATGKIRHCVFLEFKPEYGLKAQLAIFEKLHALKPLISGFIGMAYGENIDLENKSTCNAGFTIDFTNKAALEAYATHPNHQKLGGELVNMCVNGGDSIIVFDILLDE